MRLEMWRYVKIAYIGQPFARPRGKNNTLRYLGRPRHSARGCPSAAEMRAIYIPHQDRLVDSCASARWNRKYRVAARFQKIEPYPPRSLLPSSFLSCGCFR